MRCIFCKKDSSSSRSREHIVPESLGNTRNVLPPGVVCDRCNNYFASKVERPVLDSPAFKSLRFHQAVPSKRNRVPAISALIAPDVPVRVRRSADGAQTVVDVPTEYFDRIASETQTQHLIFHVGGMPSDVAMSRFLAKCALEALAQRVGKTQAGVDMIVDDPQFDPIRGHARLGRPKQWAFATRELYEANRKIVASTGDSGQTVYEYDVFFTTPENTSEDGAILSELYFALCIFGVEFVINLGGPDVDGYRDWLARNDQVSPLYFGKNEGVFEPV
jgi:hypothetical protein